MKLTKKLISMLLALAMIIAGAAVYAAAENTNDHMGDVNLDGKYNLMDCVVMLQIIAGWDIDDSNISYENADLTQDGKLNLLDVTEYLQYIAENTIRWYVPTTEYYGWLEVCSDLRKQKLPGPTFDEYLVDIGIDPALYNEWEMLRYDMNMISYEDWLQLRAN